MAAFPNWGVKYETTIPLSGTVAEPAVEVRGAALLSLFAPVVTSCAVTARGNFDTTSAGFLPFAAVNGSAWSWAVGVGSVAAMANDLAAVAAFKLVAGVPQAAARTFTVYIKR